MIGFAQSARVILFGHISRGPNAEARLVLIRSGQPKEPRVSKLATLRAQADFPTTPTPKEAA